MLAQNFKTPAALHISQEEFDSLTKVLVLLETEQIKHAPKITGLMPMAPDGGRPVPEFFNMSFMLCETDCGTAGCIAGWARYIARDKHMFLRNLPSALNNLFMMGPNGAPPIGRASELITPSEAAMALRSYLTTGSANWKEALAH